MTGEDEVREVLDYDAGIYAEVQAIRDSLNRILELLEAKREMRKEPRSRVPKKAPLQAGEVLQKLKEVDETAAGYVTDVTTFPSGDLLVKFKSLEKDEYKRLLNAMKQAFNDRVGYSRKYHGFVLKS